MYDTGDYMDLRKKIDFSPKLLKFIFTQNIETIYIITYRIVL